MGWRDGPCVSIGSYCRNVEVGEREATGERDAVGERTVAMGDCGCDCGCGCVCGRSWAGAGGSTYPGS
jgi:hypothetical protein